MAHLPLGVVQVVLGEDVVRDVEGLVPCILELAGAQVEPALVVAVDRGQHDVHDEEQALRRTSSRDQSFDHDWMEALIPSIDHD